MRISCLGTPRALTLLIASLMVIVGIALTRSSGDRPTAMPPPRPARPRAPAAAQQPTQSKAPLASPPRLPVAKPPEGRPAARPAPSPPGERPELSAAEVSRPPSKLPPLGPAASRPGLPPFPAPGFPPLDPGVLQASTGPSPSVLWVSGVIEGSPKLALLRRGENRYMVKEGGSFEGYKVIRITSNSVTIQRGGRKRTLRVGQH